MHFTHHYHVFLSQNTSTYSTFDTGDVACAFEELAAAGGIVPLLLIARAMAIDSDGHASVFHLSSCIAVLAARTSAIIRTPLEPAVAAAAAAAAVQLTAAYHNRGRSKLQFGWTDDAREDFAIAGGIASSSLHVTHRVRKAAQLAAKQAALAAVAAAKVAAKTVAATDKRNPQRSRRKKQRQKKGGAFPI